MKKTTLSLSSFELDQPISTLQNQTNLIITQASAISLNNYGVLIRGKPGTGKSSLILDLIFSNCLKDPKLIGDDIVTLKFINDRLLLDPFKNMIGKIEARGIGIIDLPVIKKVPLKLVCTLTPAKDIPRLPTDSQKHINILGTKIDHLLLSKDNLENAKLILRLYHWLVSKA